MIDALFGSKTRVKLLHLFFNNPGKAFYVREITRLIDEQINSVRRELSNLMEAGVITSDSADNKLYYEVNEAYEFYGPFRGIFAKTIEGPKMMVAKKAVDESWAKPIKALSGIRVAVAAGALVQGSASPVDLLISGEVAPSKLKQAIKTIEARLGRELTYSVVSYDEFYYRLSVRDKFITEILTNKHEVLVDADNILKLQN